MSIILKPPPTIPKPDYAPPPQKLQQRILPQGIAPACRVCIYIGEIVPDEPLSWRMCEWKKEPVRLNETCGNWTYWNHETRS